MDASSYSDGVGVNKRIEHRQLHSPNLIFPKVSMHFEEPVEVSKVQRSCLEESFGSGWHLCVDR